MSTTPSPAKRARLPTSSNVASATNSPFPGASSSNAVRPHPGGPRSVGPTGTPAIGLGMSPVDAFSPSAGAEPYAMSGFTPYNTTSPAYASGVPSAMTAASPISAALAHGTRILSGIQGTSPLYTTGPTPQPYQSRFSNQHASFGASAMSQHPLAQHHAHQQHQQQQPHAVKPPPVPHQGSVEYLKLSLQHLQSSLLPSLDSDAEAFFDAVDSALALTADTRIVAQKASAFQTALDTLLTYLEKNGLASIPLLPPSHSATDPAPTPTPPPPPSATNTDPTAPKQAELNAPEERNKPPEPPSTSTLDHQIIQLQHQAKELFDRRQRLKESASIITGILDS